MPDLLSVLSSIKVSLQDEKVTQLEIENYLALAGLEFQREVWITDRDKVDFLVGNVAVEVKIKGSRASIQRQLERYSKSNLVSKIVLLTARSILLPATLDGKPVIIISLSRAWL